MNGAKTFIITASYMSAILNDIKKKKEMADKRLSMREWLEIPTEVIRAAKPELKAALLPPSDYIGEQIQAICGAMGVPNRIFVGQEENIQPDAIVGVPNESDPA